MTEFEQYWKQFQNDPALKSAVIISAKPGCFIAGADIKYDHNLLLYGYCSLPADAIYIPSMLAAQKTAESVTALAKNGQAAMDAIEASSKPVVAAIMGSCLGGGNEVLMCYVFSSCSLLIFFNSHRFACEIVMLGVCDASLIALRLAARDGLPVPARGERPAHGVLAA